MINKTFGVIGICGANNNLIARILSQNGYNVIATDTSQENECKFKNTLNNNIKVYYGETPDEFFKKADYIVPPLSLSKTSSIYKKHSNFMQITDIIERIPPEKPVFGITGTNGKTTSTTLLKKIAYDNNIKPVEHGLKGMQGNAEYIPILQSRLNGDVAILEVGTFGIPNSIKRIVENTQMNAGLITNITPDHISDNGNFMGYANVKGEFISHIKQGLLIVNGQDPTIMGLIKKLNFKGKLITFGVDEKPDNIAVKECVCGRKINVKEIISGSGYYLCPCGITTPQLDYIATNVDLKNKIFDLHTPTEKITVKMNLEGLHNVYNIVGVIASAHEFLKLPYEKILKSIEKFTGVSGRMEKIKKINNKIIYVDYAHNPAGVETTLKEFKKMHGEFTLVITVSSESGYEGDLEIFKKALKFSKYIIASSTQSQKVAIDFLEKEPELKKQIICDDVGDFKKTTTLGASKKEVINGLKKAIDTDCENIIVIGEAAFKFKNVIFDL